MKEIKPMVAYLPSSLSQARLPLALKCSHYRKHQNSATKKHHRKHVRYRPKIKQQKNQPQTQAHESPKTSHQLHPPTITTAKAFQDPDVKPLSTEMLTIQECEALCVISFYKKEQRHKKWQRLTVSFDGKTQEHPMEICVAVYQKTHVTIPQCHMPIEDHRHHHHYRSELQGSRKKRSHFIASPVPSFLTRLRVSTLTKLLFYT